MKDKRKRKLLLVLPLLVIPFITMAFWALGGGRSPRHISEKITGLNTHLPDAHIKEDKLLDKLSFYDMADKDSIKLLEWKRNDPYYHETMRFDETATPDLERLAENTASKYHQRLNLSPYDTERTAPEQQLLKKLSQLQSELNKNNEKSYMKDAANLSFEPKISNELDRLEDMMDQVHHTDGEDPEMNQLSSVMDKILDIQHPERVKERLKESYADPAPCYAISATLPDTNSNGFFSIAHPEDHPESNGIKAVVHENQVLVNGAIIKLRLLQDLYILFTKIPAGNFVYGTVSLSGERLNVAIHSIRNQSDLLPVQLEVYDLDGLPGIYIPGVIKKDILKEPVSNGIELIHTDASLKSQVASAGIGTLKGLLNKSRKLTKLSVKSGYQLLLKNKKL